MPRSDNFHYTVINFDPGHLTVWVLNQIYENTHNFWNFIRNPHQNSSPAYYLCHWLAFSTWLPLKVSLGRGEVGLNIHVMGGLPSMDSKPLYKESSVQNSTSSVDLGLSVPGKMSRLCRPLNFIYRFRVPDSTPDPSSSRIHRMSPKVQQLLFRHRVPAQERGTYTIVYRKRGLISGGSASHPWTKQGLRRKTRTCSYKKDYKPLLNLKGAMSGC